MRQQDDTSFSDQQLKEIIEQAKKERTERKQPVNILQHTENHGPTSMEDVYNALVGERVTVYVGNSLGIEGILVAHNDALLQITNSADDNYYIPVTQVVAIRVAK